MKTARSVLVVLALATAPFLTAAADPMTVGSNDSVRTVLAKYKGKAVYVRLKDGGEMSGKVRMIGTSTLHLGEVGGREFFDAAIDVGEISAVIARTRDR